MAASKKKTTIRASSTNTELESTIDPAARVLRRFRIVFNAVKTHFRQIESAVGIGGAQVWALSVVQAQPGIGISELARAMDVHQSTASNLVKSLVHRGLVVARKGGEDRRSVTLRVSPEGRMIVRKAPGPHTGVLPEALASLDPRTLARLDKDLGKLMAALSADEAAAGFLLSQTLQASSKKAPAP